MHSKSKTTTGVRPARVSREEKRLQTNTALREAALREFAQFGASGTSAERIAEAAGFTRGAFYANYDNKHTLLLDLIRERTMDEQASWAELANSQLDLDALLDALSERAERFDPDGQWAFIAAETYLYALRDKDFAKSYREYYASIRDAFERIIESVLARAGKRAVQETLDEFCDAMLAVSRSVRLPPASNPGAAPLPFSSTVLSMMLRGLIAISPPA